MRTHAKTATAALIATITLALAITATTAAARNYSVSEKEWEILFRNVTFEAAGNNISCPVTLLGRFVERTIPKIFGTQVGAIRHALPLTGAEPNPCTGGSMTILNASLPWLIYYQGFTGRLPSISAIRQSMVGVAFRVRTRGGIGCLAGTTRAEPAFGENLIGASGRVEGLRFDETRAIRLQGPFACSIAGTSRFSGTGTVLDLPGLNAITVTLI